MYQLKKIDYINLFEKEKPLSMAFICIYNSNENICGSACYLK